MFEAGGGVPVQDQFHQFIASSNSSAASASAVASRTPTSISVALPLPNFLHPHASSSFDPYTFASSTAAAAAASSTSAQQVQHFLHQLHQLPHPPPPPQLTTTKIINQGKVQETNNSNMVGMNLEINERDQTSADSWSNDEVLALLRIRSSIENWFPDFTWEHVSRKLAEVGFKLRSGEKCKEKFEEESRYFNNNIHYTNNNKISNYCTVFSEYEDLYHHGDQHHHQTHPNHDHDHDQVGLAADQENKKILESDKPISDDHDQEEDKMRQNLQEDQEEDNINPRIDHQTVVSSDHDQMRSRSTKNKKRKRRHRKFEMLKGFCEGVVKRLMDQQEEMHNKILEDMVRRDEEKFARAETWKKQEMDRMNQEIEVRAQEQVVAGDRQAKIIKFLKEFTSSSVPVQNLGVNKKVSQNPNPQIESSSSSLPPHENPSSDNAPISLNNPKIQSLSPPPPPQNPSKSLPPQNLRTKSITASASNEKLDNDIGKRWPRDEVLALINLRSSTVYNNNDSNNNDHQEMKEGGGNNSNKDQKAPLWERISQGMAELGYNRSAKRCKEKWENINKYFRKTKDINKKRSVDSRTCPYFHQLSNLYNNQASSVLIAPSDDDLTGPTENRSSSPENRSVVPEANGSSSTLHGLEGDKSVVQEPGFDYEL